MDNILKSNNQEFQKILIELFKGGRSYSYRKFEYILHADEEPGGVYMLKSGCVKSFTISSEGNERIDYFHQPGDIFPLLWAFDGFSQRNFYSANSDVTVYRIPKVMLINFFQSNPNHTLHFLDNFIHGMYLYRNHIENLEIKDSLSRIVYFFVDACNRYTLTNGEKISNQVEINPFYINHQDIANYLNMARETVTKKIQILTSKKLISLNRSSLIIHDLKTLKSLLD